MNSQYTFEPAYLTCLANHMHDSKPFGDVPLKMASSVKRSMVATRTLIRALRSGHAIAENVKKVKNNRQPCSFAEMKRVPK
jgi:hypothetical protein